MTKKKSPAEKQDPSIDTIRVTKTWAKGSDLPGCDMGPMALEVDWKREYDRLNSEHNGYRQGVRHALEYSRGVKD